MLPEHMRESVIQWIEAPLPPRLLGSFLRSVLSNDLREAVAHGDAENVAALKSWVLYLYNYAPAACWGSWGDMERWYAAHVERGTDAHAAARMGSPIDGR
jgi:hypothetical protein